MLRSWIHGAWITAFAGLTTACVSDEYPLSRASDDVCAAWTDILGESHQCSNAEGGALNADLVRRDITQHVVTEGYPLPHKEYAQISLLFHDDGSYEAHKLKFTGYSTWERGQSILLVYGEDSRGQYQVNPNGTILLKEPEFSTCGSRTGAGKTIIYPHTQAWRRHEPYRTSFQPTTTIAFGASGWLESMTGEDYWSGTIESRRDFKLPPLASREGDSLRYRFEGYWGDIHYGCLNKGFQDFVSQRDEKIRLQDEKRYEAGVDPQKLHKGTHFLVTP